MKVHKKTTLAAVILSLVFLLASAGVYAQQQAKTVSVDSFIGKMEYRVGKAAWKTASIGDQIPLTAEVRVKGTNDSADLVLPDGTVVKIAGGSQKTVNELVLENDKSRSANTNKMAPVKADPANSLTVGVFVGNCEYRVGDGDWIALKVGDKVPENSEVRVGGKNDSLDLNFPDGSVVQVFGLTSLKVVDIVKNKNGKKASFLSLLAGKIFAKIMKAADQDFQVETSTGIASVRGTRFGVFFLPGTGGSIVVSEGSVAVIDPLGKFQPLLLQKGFMSTLSGIAGGLPGSPMAASLEKILEFDPEYKPDTGSASSVPAPTPPPTPAPSPQPQQTKTASAECSEQGVNWSVSAENIDGKVWNKVLLSPTFKFGTFSFALYLPIYFQNMDDVFYPNRWYNSYEWNFSTWPDALQSILLKIRFVQFQNDNVLFKLGNMPDMTIGHGSLVNGYANDLEFPSKRRIGIQFNLDLGQFGFETMAGDVFLTKLFAGRIFARPLYGIPVIGNLGIGISSFIDQDPLMNNKSRAFGFSADLDLPLFKFPMFNMTLYSDAATLGYSDDTYQISQLTKGLGLFAGVKGTLIVIDYEAQYRRIQGGFIPNYVDKFYDVNRVYNFSVLAYGLMPDFNGFLVSAGKTFEGLGGVSLSYQHYFQDTSSTNINNFFHMEAKISKCLFKKAYGLIAYDRQNFAFGDLFSSFLGNGAIVTTQVFYEVAPGAYIGLMVRKFYQADASGNIQEKYTFGLTTDIGL